MGNQETRAQTGFANWFQDFPHPANFMFLVSGRSIQPRSNQNLGNIDDPEITAEIERLRLEADLERVARARAVLDRKVVARAHVVSYGHRKRSTFLSERMDFDNCSLFHPLYGNDYSSFCLK
jgi:peptide/nickel transport system substrate-binding protein